ncbi:hypothetical protein [Corynebacterium aquilae]|uniref:Uncharacterized protein n=1 Tax=Corynebacterium aquilae DSM 44791 TaxID=1431546 RepID=A0A1L7CE04_9CORY|nr:hypothetical protein [Corynebacterium aquilae]APT84079.1 hypothetical protein CAQU_02205 [Corynebacterium aquilae DSM 44791]
MSTMNKAPLGELDHLAAELAAASLGLYIPNMTAHQQLNEHYHRTDGLNTGPWKNAATNLSKRPKITRPIGGLKGLVVQLLIGVAGGQISDAISSLFSRADTKGQNSAAFASLLEEAISVIDGINEDADKAISTVLYSLPSTMSPILTVLRLINPATHPAEFSTAVTCGTTVMNQALELISALCAMRDEALKSCYQQILDCGGQHLDTDTKPLPGAIAQKVDECELAPANSSSSAGSGSGSAAATPAAPSAVGAGAQEDCAPQQPAAAPSAPQPSPAAPQPAASQPAAVQPQPTAPAAVSPGTEPAPAPPAAPPAAPARPAETPPASATPTPAPPTPATLAPPAASAPAPSSPGTPVAAQNCEDDTKTTSGSSSSPAPAPKTPTPAPPPTPTVPASAATPTPTTPVEPACDEDAPKPPAQPDSSPESDTATPPSEECDTTPDTSSETEGSTDTAEDCEETTETASAEESESSSSDEQQQDEEAGSILDDIIDTVSAVDWKFIGQGVLAVAGIGVAIAGVGALAHAVVSSGVLDGVLAPPADTPPPPPAPAPAPAPAPVVPAAQDCPPAPPAPAPPVAPEPAPTGPVKGIPRKAGTW